MHAVQEAADAGKEYKGEFHPDDSWMQTIILKNRKVQVVNGEVPLQEGDSEFTLDAEFTVLPNDAPNKN